MKKDEGSKEEEAAESPEEEKTEQMEGKEGVVIPEDFQQATHELLQKADTKHHLSHIRDRVYAKEDEMRQEEMKKNKKSGTKGPQGTMSVDTAIEG